MPISGNTGRSPSISQTASRFASGGQRLKYRDEEHPGSDGHLSVDYCADGPGLRRGSHPYCLKSNTEELLFFPGGVQVYSVDTNGHISTCSYSSYLRITVPIDRPSNPFPDRAPAHLQTCDLVRALYPDTLVLLSSSGVFTFPQSSTTGSCIAVVLSSELPESEHTLFRKLLSQLTNLRVQPLGAEGVTFEHRENTSTKPLNQPVSRETEHIILPKWSERLSQSIQSGSSWLGQGLVKGGDHTGRAIQQGGTWLRQHITPEDTPHKVSPNVTRGLQVAQHGTTGAVKISHFLVDGVSTVVGCVGKEVAPHVKRHGNKLIPASVKENKSGRSNMNGAKAVASSGVQGLSTLWTSLEMATKTVGRSASSETVATVKHKYGEEAGDATNSALGSVRCLSITAFNMNNLLVQGILKSARRQSTMTTVDEAKAE
ncbi:spartin-like [Denticeps clupeoides]|uniref:spartin-like n=1 Tax=Denticeps clupeoides TaxID=299321 RepID=UPI0010A58C3C|nr:spartin-like [Denticeps clupeoides]